MRMDLTASMPLDDGITYSEIRYAFWSTHTVQCGTCGPRRSPNGTAQIHPPADGDSPKSGEEGKIENAFAFRSAACTVALEAQKRRCPVDRTHMEGGT